MGGIDKDNSLQQKCVPNKFSKDIHFMSLKKDLLFSLFGGNEAGQMQFDGTIQRRKCLRKCEVTALINFDFLGHKNSLEKQASCTMMDIELRDTAAAIHLPACFEQLRSMDR